jgi:hypothetical protein
MRIPFKKSLDQIPLEEAHGAQEVANLSYPKAILFFPILKQ